MQMCIYTTDRPCLQPYTVNFKHAFKYFPKLNILMYLHGNVLGCCQSAALATVAEMAQGFKDARHHHICHSSYGLTINGRLLADRTKLYMTDSAHHFSVKLSLFMCKLAACSGSPPQCSTFSGITNTCKSAKQKLGLLYRNFQRADQKTLSHLYKALVLSRLDYTSYI